MIKEKSAFFSLIFLKNHNISFLGIYFHHPSLGPGSAVGEKRQKTGSIRKNIGERSERSGILGSGKDGRASRHAFKAAVP